MRPLLDDLELPNVQAIKTRERRALAEHKPSGMDGSQLQNMGREPASVTLCGVATGPFALELVEQLDGKFRAQTPVSFVADIVADSQIEQMRIDDLRIQDLAGKPGRFAYHLALCEHIEVIEPAETAGVANIASATPTDAEAVESEIASDASENHESAVEGVSTQTGVLEVTVELLNPDAVINLEVLVEGETDEGETVSFVLRDHNNGVFRKPDLESGTYTVSLSSPQHGGES